MVNHGSGNWENDTTVETFATHLPGIFIFPLPYGRKSMLIQESTNYLVVSARLRNETTASQDLPKGMNWFGKDVVHPHLVYSSSGWNRSIRHKL